MEKTFFVEIGDGAGKGIKMYTKKISLEEFFREYLCFEELPPLDTFPKLIRPFCVFTTPFYNMVVFEVDWGKGRGGLMSRHFEKRGSVALVRVDDEGEKKFAFVEQNRFLFGPLLETVRGFDPVKKELSEELDLSEEPKPVPLCNVRINTGISMTKSAQGDIPISIVDVKKKPNAGRGDEKEKITGVQLLTLAEIRERYLEGAITDPWFSHGLLNLLMQERPEVFTGDSVTIYL